MLDRLPPNPKEDTAAAHTLIAQMLDDTAKAADNLLSAKAAQSHFANQHHAPDPDFAVGDRVMLSTMHCHQDYIAGHAGHVAKFMPCYDGPYTILDAHPKLSSYTLDLLSSGAFLTFHASLLRKFIPNDSELFPSHDHKPGPVLTADGLEEWFVDRILDERSWGCGKRYLVHWKGYNSSYDHWLPGSKLKDNVVLDVWESHRCNDSG